MQARDLEKAALRGEPSYLWRSGQERRLQMICRAAGDRLQGVILENGCGVGMYLHHLQAISGRVFGLEFDFARAGQARQISDRVVCAAGEELPFPPGCFDLVLSHEVLEHVQDDRRAVEEIVRTLKPGGRLVLFVPNRGYPFETHGIFWRGKYHFGNIPLINYLPRRWRDRLAPHVRIYSRRDLERLFSNLPLRPLARSILFGAYDNLIARFGPLGRALRAVLQALERTPFQVLGLSHFWILDRKSVV